MKSIKYIFLLSFLVFATEAFGQRTVTLTTYYPAPFGVYQRMRVTEDLIVGADVDQEPDATLHIEGSAYIAGGTGDSTLDGNVNIYDIVTTMNFQTEQAAFTPEQFAEADITGTGIVGPHEQELLVHIIQNNINLDDPLHRIAIRRPLGRMIFPICEDTGAACLDADNYGYAIGAWTRREEGQGRGPWWSTIYISSTGEVGIGTGEPEAILDVSGADALIHGITVGRGGGERETNTAIGNNALSANTTGIHNTAIGWNALEHNTTGTHSTAVGCEALRQNTADGHSNTAVGFRSLWENTTGNQNTAVGRAALRDNLTGNQNTAVGNFALWRSTSGSENTAVGYETLRYNLGSRNTAVGRGALRSPASDDSTGSDNTAVGYNALFANTTGRLNVAFGGQALSSNTTGEFNSAFGFAALFSSTASSHNSAFGHQSLFMNTTGIQNTAVGSQALQENTSGSRNTAIGSEALYVNWIGSENVAVGHEALRMNRDGDYNTAVGQGALRNNSIGLNNTAMGNQALFHNLAHGNTAVGSQALANNTTGASNTAVGFTALISNTTGHRNTVVGKEALTTNTTGSNNTAVGRRALHLNASGLRNTAIGVGALKENTTGDYNTAVGWDAGPEDGSTDLQNTTAIGNGARVSASHTVRIGNSDVESIGGHVEWSNGSDGRFKKDVQENVPGLDFIEKLRPVTFHWDMEKLKAFEDQPFDQGAKEKGKKTYTGFIAQEVQQAAEAVGYDFSAVNKPQNEKDQYFLGYSTFVVPLVKAVQELQAHNKALELKIEKMAQDYQHVLKILEEQSL